MPIDNTSISILLDFLVMVMSHFRGYIWSLSELLLKLILQNMLELKQPLLSELPVEFLLLFLYRMLR